MDADVDAGLFVCGADLVVDGTGNVTVLEMNDRPTGLSTIYWQARSGRNLAHALGEAMLARPGMHERLVLVLPDAFCANHELVPERAGRPWVCLEAGTLSDDRRIDFLLRDLTSFGEAAGEAGIPFAVVGRDVVEAAGPPAFDKAAVWNRSQAQLLGVHVVNDPRAAAICIDKSSTRAALAGQGHNLPFKIWVRGHVAPQVDWSSEYSSLKPRSGSGSRDIERVLTSTLRSGDRVAREDMLLEPWVEAAAAMRPGTPHLYRFDLRVVVIAGKAAGVIARRAAAPCNGELSESALSWLTTTGPVLSVAPDPSLTGDCVLIGNDAITVPHGILAKAYAVAERSVSSLQDQVVRSVRVPYGPSFAQIHGITDLRRIRVRPVELGGRTQLGVCEPS